MRDERVDELGRFGILRRGGEGVLRADREDVEEQGTHDADTHPHGLQPTVDEGLLCSLDQLTEEADIQQGRVAAP
ncbi:hypothetical protein [Nocardia sp. NPDC003979]